MSTKGKHMRTADIQRNPTERVHFSVMVWLNGNPLQYSCLESGGIFRGRAGRKE